MNKKNYDLLMWEQIEKIKSLENKPSLLLHTCCAPCSSMVINTLKYYFNITIFFYNPNITESDEYYLRLNEMKKYIEDRGLHIDIVEGIYNPKEDFFKKVKGLEKCHEGGERCKKCYSLRMNETAKFAKEKGFDFFTTALSISPLKNSTWINEIGVELSEIYSVNYLYGDFKKKGRYQESIKISREYNLYRQDYCGCIFSKIESENYRKAKAETEGKSNE